MDICEVYPKGPPYQISRFSPILNSRVHYLKGDPKPVWMDGGVPALEKGIHQGLEYVEGDED